jgi:hypothetical protein
MKYLGKMKRAMQVAALCLMAASTASHAQLIDLDKVTADNVNVGDLINFGGDAKPLVMPKGNWKLLAQSDFVLRYGGQTKPSKAVTFRNPDASAPLQVIMVSSNPSTFWRMGKPTQTSCQPYSASNVQSYKLPESGKIYACSEFYQQLALPELLGNLKGKTSQDFSAGAQDSLVAPLLANPDVLANLGNNPIIINVRVFRQGETKTSYTFMAKAPQGNLMANDAEANRKSLEDWVRSFTQSAISMVMEDKPLVVGEFPKLSPMGEVVAKAASSSPSEMKFDIANNQKGWDNFQNTFKYDRIFLASKDKKYFQTINGCWPFTKMVAFENRPFSDTAYALMVNETYMPLEDSAK